MADLEVTENVSVASQFLRDAISDRSAHSQRVKSVTLTNWVIKASTEVANQSQVQDFIVGKETRPVYLTGVRSDVATEIGRPNTTPLFFGVPSLTHSNQTSISFSQKFVLSNATQPQPEPTNPDSVSMMAQQIAASKPNSSFTVPAKHILPNLSAWIYPTIGCSVSHVARLQSAPQGISRAPNTDIDNNATVPQVVPVTSGGTVYYLNLSSRPKIVGRAMPIIVSLTAPMAVGRSEVVPTEFIATTRMEPTALRVQNLAQLLAS